MKLSSAGAVAAAIGCFSHLAEARAVKSPLFDWSYELDPSAPIITSMDDMDATAKAWNNTVSIEHIEGTFMLVEQLSKTQVATFGGALLDWARANEPTEEQLAAARDSGKIDEMEANGILAAIATGMSMDDVVEARTLARRDTLRQSFKWDCHFCPGIPIFSCKWMGCTGLCLAFICVPRPTLRLEFANKFGEPIPEPVYKYPVGPDYEYKTPDEWEVRGHHGHSENLEGGPQ
ncbi:hypothetical protein QBC34DRAFT_143355 [Podospora aff. communis PSN243]|uniref:Uncharacterized protein n=1 Tax=Podospora aff. communis PSN243 TaxID=3040156 RepID=A0AAV9GIE0_9PEZI|nr:hypothetical protein QBC34DRAFT_143355 [Podospora aff. communis PSN243]